MASSRNIWHKPPVIRDRGSANHHTPGRDPATRTTNIINPYPSGGVPPPWEGVGTERSTGRMMYFFTSRAEGSEFKGPIEHQRRTPTQPGFGQQQECHGQANEHQ